MENHSRPNPDRMDRRSRRHPHISASRWRSHFYTHCRARQSVSILADSKGLMIALVKVRAVLTLNVTDTNGSGIRASKPRAAKTPIDTESSTKPQILRSFQRTSGMTPSKTTRTRSRFYLLDYPLRSTVSTSQNSPSSPISKMRL